MNKLYFLLIVILGASSVNAQLASFVPRGIGGGGALFFPRINPANDNEYYVACDMSEMFHSTDYGHSYTQIDFTKLQALNVSTYEFTNDNNIAYSNFNDGNNGYAVKTTNGGTSWVQLAGYDPNEGEVYAMKANYNNPQQLLMNYYDKIVISNDGGNTFQTVATETNNGVGIIMGGVFFDGSNIYVGTNQGLIYSTNGGTSFSTMTTTGITAGQVIWQFAGAKQNSTTRFCCITGTSANIYCGLMPYDYSGLVAGIYTMDNAGGTWVNKTGTISVTNDYVMYVGMAENDISNIYLGGHDNSTGGPLVYKSANGGNSWSKVFNTSGNQNIVTGWEGSGGDKQWSWGETCFGITVAPNNANKVMFGSFSDIHLTADGGTSWQQAYVNINDQHAANANTPTHQAYHSIGLENTTCWQVDWQSQNQMTAAFSDIGAIRSADSGNSWSYNYTGMSVNSTYRIAKTPGGTMLAATSGVHDMYQSTRLKDAQLDVSDASGKINYSTDHGATWSVLHSFGHPVFWVAIDPNDSNKAYASVINYGSSLGGIYMTSNLNALAGSTWTQLAAPPRTQGHPACIVVLNDGKVLCTFSGRISGGSTFTNSSGVFLYDPGTSSWSDVSDANMYYWTKDIVADPNDASQNTWYACVFTNWGATANGQGGLYRTTNRGTSWTKLTGSQFDRVTSISFNPQNLSQAYLTTETQGLWMTNNVTAATPTWSLVNSYPFRQPERVFFNPYNTAEMWVTSFGNGMKVSSSSPVNEVKNTSGIETMEVYPNPAYDRLLLDKCNTRNKAICIYDITGRLVSRIAPQQDGVKEINVATLPAGSYLIRIGDKVSKFVKN